MSCFAEIFSKREGRIHINFDKHMFLIILPRIQHKVVVFLFCKLHLPKVSDYSVSCNKDLGKNTLSDRRQSVDSFPLFLRQLSLMCQRCILTVTIDFKLVDIKLESSEANICRSYSKIYLRVPTLLTYFVKMRF